MKKRFTIILLLMAGMGMSFAQNYVSTDPQNKNAIIEEFTGVRCGYCPQGHAIIVQILETYPGQAFVVGYHPSSSGLCQPYSGDPDFRRSFPNAFFTTSYCGTGPFMPGAFVNRKKWTASERLRSRGSWMSHTAQIISEPSPLNVGLSSSYDIFADEVTINVEVYFTSTVNQNLTLYVTLSENGLVAQQSGGSSNYVHHHVFREAFAAQWGNPINNTTQGSYETFTFYFNNSQTAYNLMSCELMAFVYDTDSEIVISGIGADIGENTYVVPQANFTAGGSTTIPIGESIVFDDESKFVPTDWNWTFEGGDPETSTEENPEVTYHEVGLFDVTLIVENPAGSDTIVKEDFIEVYDPVNVQEYQEAVFTIYPNPSSGLFNVSLVGTTGYETATLYSISGEKLLEITPDNKEFTLDISEYTAGIYFLSMQSHEDTYTQKIVLKK